MAIPIGNTYPLQLLITSGGGIVGQSPTVILQRQSDFYYWDGNVSFVVSPVKIPMPAVDPVNQPGLYSVSFNESIMGTPDTFVAYYENTGIYSGSAVEEIVFANPIVPSPTVNYTAIASAVAAKILLNPAIPINSADIASDALLSMVNTEVEYIEDNMALESTLLSGLTTIDNDLNQIISIIQPTSGNNQITFSFIDQNSNPIPGIKVTIKNTTSLITLAVGISDINGNLVLGLPNGTFSVLFFRSFVQFPTMPFSLVVNGNATVTVPCTTFQPTAPSVNLCAAYIYLIDAAGNPIPNIMIRSKQVSNYPYSSGSGILVTKGYQTSVSDGTGFCQLNLIIGSYVEISSPALFFTVTDYLVPNQASLDLSTLLPASS